MSKRAAGKRSPRAVVTKDAEDNFCDGVLDHMLRSAPPDPKEPAPEVDYYPLSLYPPGSVVPCNASHHSGSLCGGCGGPVHVLRTVKDERTGKVADIWDPPFTKAELRRQRERRRGIWGSGRGPVVRSFVTRKIRSTNLLTHGRILESDSEAQFRNEIKRRGLVVTKGPGEG